jgi:hypothetical protein
MLAAGAAPAVVRASSLMPIWVPREIGPLLVTQTMDGTILSIEMITQEALRILHAKTAFVNTINRQYDAAFKQGDVLRIRVPKRYEIRS